MPARSPARNDSRGDRVASLGFDSTAASTPISVPDG
jgi:hypothetical protein